MTKSYRFIFGALILLLALTATPALAVPPSNDNMSNAMMIHPTAQYTVTSVQDATIEGGEFEHTCYSGGPSAGENSVWFKFGMGPGTVTLDTAGSSYATTGTTSSDTIISVYVDDVFDGYPPVGCSDNGTASASISFHTGSYGNLFLVQVSSAAGFDADLPSQVQLSISFSSPNTPSYNNFANALNVKLPNGITTVLIETATQEAGEPGFSCDAFPTPFVNERFSHSVWFKFELSTSRYIILSPVHSSYGLGYDLVDAPVADLFIGSSLGSLAKVACDSFGYISGVFPAGTYYLRVMAPTEGGLGGTGLVQYVFAASVTENIFFTEGSDGLDGWKLKNPSGDGVQGCPISCAGFRFVGGPGEDSVLKQSSDLTGLKFKKNDILLWTTVYATTGGAPDAQLKIKVKYLDGSPATTITHSFVDAPMGASPTEYHFITKGKVAKIVTKISNKSTSGTIDINGVLVVPARYAGAQPRGADGVLPVPAAPGAAPSAQFDPKQLLR